MSKRIPPHTNCKNCGKCCGIIPASAEEVAAIRKYLAEHPAAVKSQPGLDCPFRDSAKARCTIYPVRPLACRLMGVIREMCCPHGNSRNIEGKKFLAGRTVDDVYVLNAMNWKEGD